MNCLIRMKKFRLIFLFVFLSGCVKIPEGITPVDNFDLNKYLGTWYEIARLDHSFERGLVSVSAEYTLRNDGGVSVVNRGYDPLKKQWKKASGRAYFVNSINQGFLKVSFFGPFYGSYIIFDLDTRDYQYALVSGPDKSYLWILARSFQIDESIIKKLVNKAKSKGFQTSDLIFVDHENHHDFKK